MIIFTGLFYYKINISHHIGAVVRIVFNSILYNEDSINGSFLLTCSFTVETVNGVIWTRDGLLLHNTGPLVSVNASTLSYTNVLAVRGRIPGTYICRIRGPNDQVLGSASIDVKGTYVT